MTELNKSRFLNNLFYLMLVFSLLGPSFGFEFHNFKLTFFRLFFLFLILVFLFKVIRNINDVDLWSVLNFQHLKIIYPYLLFFLFWLCYGLLGLCWVKSLSLGLRYLLYLFMMLVLTVSIVYFSFSKSKAFFLMKILFFTFTFIIFYGVFESITLIHLPASRFFYVVSASVTSVFTNQNDLATCATLGLPFIISSLYMLNISPSKKLFIYFVGVLTLYILIATGSRSNTILALPTIIITLLAVLPFTVAKEKFTRKNLTLAFFAVVFALLFVSFMSQVFLSENARKSAKSKFASIFGVLLDIQESSWDLEDEEVVEGKTGQSATVRKYLILNGLNFLKKSYYLGVGSGNIEAHMKDAPKVNKVNMHNWWVEVLVNFGVVVFSFYIYLYFLLLKKLFFLFKAKGISNFVRFGLSSSFVSLVGYFFGAIAPSTAIHFVPMWLVYGLALTFLILGSKEVGLQKLT